MTELDCRILARACNLQWSIYPRPTFTTPDDWELVRVKIIAGPNVGAFHQWLIDHKSWLGSGFEWWLMRTPEQCCQLVCNWIKARPDLFPWVVGMEG